MFRQHRRTDAFFLLGRYDCWHYVEDEELKVWMRTATFTTFWKLHRKISGDLKKGDYELAIDLRYPVGLQPVCMYPLRSLSQQSRTHARTHHCF
jgi:hypothetical protein